MKKHVFLALAMAALAGCSSESSKSRPDNLLASNDFESMEGWNGDAPLPPSLTKEKAHSGAYSMRVGPGIEYANGFIGELGKLSPTRLTELQVKAWVYVPEGQTGNALVTQLMDPATNQGILWQAFNLDHIKRNEWVQVEKSIELPASTGPGFKLYAYLWGGKSQNVAYIDDMEIYRIK